MRETKQHQDQTYLLEKINSGYTTKEIANENRVSYKLIELYLRKYGIKFQSLQPS